MSLVRNPSPGAKNAMYLSGLAAVGMIAYYSLTAKSSSRGDLAPAVTEEEAREVLRAITDRVKLTVPRLMKFGDGIKQQIAMQGQEIDDMQLFKSVLLPHLETGIRDIEQSVLDERGIDNDEFEEAVNVYCAAGDQELLSLAATLKKIYTGFGGEISEDGEEGTAVSEKSKKSSSSEMSLEDLVAYLQLLSDQILQCMDEYAGEFVANYGPPNDVASLQEFQMGLMAITEGYDIYLICF